MHARVTRAALAAAAALSMTALWAQPAPPAAAEANPTLGNHAPDSYSKAASFLAATGSHSGSGGSTGCQVSPLDPGREVPGGNQPLEGHYEWHSYLEADGTYSVWLNCVANGAHVPNDRSQQFPASELWEVVWFTLGVVPQDLDVLAAEALSRLRPPEAGIHTEPGDGRNALVGSETWFWLDEAVYGQRQEVWDYDGPVINGQRVLAVRVWAEPQDGATVVWNTGDGTERCANGGRPAGSCTHEYNRSSAGQGAVDTSGDPAYEISATYAYRGGYDVYVLGDLVDSGTLDDIPRTSEAVLAVADAEALNTDHGA